MPSFGFRLGVPPPVTVVETSAEDVITVSKIEVTRPGTVTFLGAWVAGNPAGVNPNQPARFQLFADDGSGLAPGSFLTRSVETNISGLRDTVECIKIPVETQVHINPGIYWVGMRLGNSLGTGEWIVYGDASAPAIRKRVNLGYAAPQPMTFPVVGVTTINGTGMAGGLVFVEDLGTITGTICGTFLCGTALVGTFVADFSAPELLLKGRATSIIATDDFEVVSMGKPKLTLKGKTAAVSTSVYVPVGSGKLILNGEPSSGQIPPIIYLPVPAKLLLRGKTFALEVSGSPSLNAADLLLLGKATSGKVPGMVPVVPIELILTPTGATSPLDLVPSVSDSLLLDPTVTVVT